MVEGRREERNATRRALMMMLLMVEPRLAVGYELWLQRKVRLMSESSDAMLEKIKNYFYD